MTDKKTVYDFTRGVMDRIRNHIRKQSPGFLEELDSAEEEITGRILRNGDRGIYTRKINREKNRK